jgi:prophage regulatory protein
VTIVTDLVAGHVGGVSAAGPSHTAPRKLLPLSEVLARVPVSRARLYQLITSGDFPRQVKIGARSAWIEHEVDAWVDRLADERGAA